MIWGYSDNSRRRGPSLAERIVGNPYYIPNPEHANTLRGELKCCPPETNVYNTKEQALEIATGEKARKATLW